jgi:hypothetical protein
MPSVAHALALAAKAGLLRIAAAVLALAVNTSSPALVGDAAIPVGASWINFSIYTALGRRIIIERAVTAAMGRQIIKRAVTAAMGRQIIERAVTAAMSSKVIT